MRKDVYIITGASSDIGVAFLRRLHTKCVVEDRICDIVAQPFPSAAVLEDLQKELPNLNIVPYQCDLATMKAVEAWLSLLQSEGIVPSHILHFASPKFNYMRIKKVDWRRMQQEINVNAGSMALLLKYFWPVMAKQKYGRVVAMLTAYTINVPPKFMSDYIMSKYALLGLIKAAASEYAGKGITINGISPNMMETKFLADIDKRSIEMNAASSAMKRNISLDEVCVAMEYLLSDEAGYINGINFNLSGGDRM